MYKKRAGTLVGRQGGLLTQPQVRWREVNGKDRRGKGKMYGKNLSDLEIRLNEKLSTYTLYTVLGWGMETRHIETILSTSDSHVKQ